MGKMILCDWYQLPINMLANDTSAVIPLGEHFVNVYKGVMSCNGVPFGFKVPETYERMRYTFGDYLFTWSPNDKVANKIVCASQKYVMYTMLDHTNDLESVINGCSNSEFNEDDAIEFLCWGLLDMYRSSQRVLQMLYSNRSALKSLPLASVNQIRHAAMLCAHVLKRVDLKKFEDGEDDYILDHTKFATFETYPQELRTICIIARQAAEEVASRA